MLRGDRLAAASAFKVARLNTPARQRRQKFRDWACGACGPRRLARDTTGSGQDGLKLNSALWPPALRRVHPLADSRAYNE